MSQPINQDEINTILWKAYDLFRISSREPYEYKNYILVMLFLKYISDVWQEGYEQQHNGDQQRIDDHPPQYERFILPKGSDYYTLYHKRNDRDIGDQINKALAVIERENPQKLTNVFHNIDFNSAAAFGQTKQRNKHICNLLEIFHDDRLDMRPSRVSNLDVIGNACEHLVSQLSSGAGRHAGEFYTPPEVSQLLATLLDPKPGDSICDPACGSGSLLIKCAQRIKGGDYTIYGQEVNGTTWALCMMNLFLHHVNVSTEQIKWGDTLRDPHLLEDQKLRRYNIVVAHPPFSLSNWGADMASKDPHNRFWRGVPPRSKGDYAFISHMIETTLRDPQDNGRVGVVMPHGVLFRGGAEGKIRQQFIEENLLDAVISLPPSLFYGTSIPVVILIFKRQKQDKTVVFIDASEEFEKMGRISRLSKAGVQKIISTYKNPHSVDGFAYVASHEEIVANDYNISVQNYVDTNPHFLELDVPENTSVNLLGDIANIQAGISLQQLKRKMDSSDIQLPYIQSSNISDGKLHAESAKKFPFSMRETLSRGYAQSGDILITITGSMGRVAIVPNTLPHGVYYDMSIYRIRVLEPDRIKPEALYHSLRMEATQAELARLNKGSAIYRISHSDLKKVRILIFPTNVVEKQVIAKSIIDALQEKVILPLTISSPDEFDNLRAKLIDVLQNTIYTLDYKKRSIKEIILQHYPLPISLAYHRMLRASHNPYEQLPRLVELHETLTYFFYNILLCDYFDNEALQKIYTPNEKKIKRAYEGYKIADRLRFIEEFLDKIRRAKLDTELKMPELVKLDFSPLQTIRKKRNNEYHSVSGSIEAQKHLVEELLYELTSFLRNLSFLENYSMCRVDHFFQQDNTLHASLELFKGALYETDMGMIQLPEDEPEHPTLIRADQSHIILLTPNYECINLHPLYQVISSEEYQYEPHLCFAKLVKEQQLKGESVQFRAEFSLDGYKYLL